MSNNLGIPDEKPSRIYDEPKSRLALIQEYDQIIQRTPINERAESEECQTAYYLLHVMNRPKFHVCTVCHMQYGNDQTQNEIKSAADVPGICHRCKA